MTEQATDNHTQEEPLAPWKIASRVGMNFHPSYSALNFGADFGKEYYEDPLFRVRQEQEGQRRLFERFGEFDMGTADPRPAMDVYTQPLDFLNHCLGGRYLYCSTESVRTPDRPLSHIETLDDVEAMADIDWETHPAFIAIFKQVSILKDNFPDEPISNIQGVCRGGPDGSMSMVVMHTPYTTAFRLLGERILELMILEPELAQAILLYIMRQYTNLWNAICTRAGWNGTKLHFGDCAATMVSPTVYENACIPLYIDLMKQFDAAVMHSCGPSSHLLDLFARIPNLSQLQLGYGTDLKKARELFPDSSIQAYYGPAALMFQDTTAIEKDLWRMAEELEGNFLIDGTSIDPNTPEPKLYAYLNTARKINDALAKRAS